MKRLLFIFNPWSGKAHVKDHLFEITDEFAKAGYLVTVYPTQRSRDCYEYLLKCAGEYDVIVCSGGDGTLNEAVAGRWAIYRVEVPMILRQVFLFRRRSHMQ